MTGKELVDTLKNVKPDEVIKIRLLVDGMMPVILDIDYVGSSWAHGICLITRARASSETVVTIEPSGL